MLLSSLLVAATSLAWAPSASAQPAPGPTPAGATDWVTPSLVEPTLAADDALRAALAGRRHAEALTLLRATDVRDLRGEQVQERAFLEAWSAIRADEAAAATSLIDAVRDASSVPADYRLLTEAELLLEAGDAVAAARVAELVNPDSGVATRAAILRARALDQSEQRAASQEAWEALSARADPAPGMAAALLTLANRAGIGSPDAYGHLRRLWSWYPTSAEARRAERILQSEYEPRGRDYRPRDQHIARRADRLMEAWQFKSVTDYLGAMESRFVTPDENACMAWYAFGRSHFKRNNVTKAAEVLRKSGTKCVGIDEDRGAKSLYIAGKALERRKMWTDAAKAYQLIPELYPGHTMADDGYALAGIAWQFAGQPDRAIELWTRQVDEYPQGDLAAEGFWRLAWTAWLAGDTDTAIGFAERMIWQVPYESDPVHVMAASYWAARWRIHPDRGAPEARHPDSQRVALGIDQLVQLCQDHPTRFYSLLAAARLRELAPARLDAIARPQPTTDAGLQVRAGWLESAPVQRGLSLARLGLVSEALVELEAASDDDTLSGTALPGEEALVALVVGHKDPPRAHDRLHHYLLKHPASTLGPDRTRILEQAYPDRYWDLTQQATEGFGYDARIFHALVREESSFNEQIVSWAGAKGLSQLMPATARRVAEWLGIRVNSTNIFDPLTNLRIGSRYLEYLREYFGGNMVLAVPAYNAGEGNVGKWLKATDNPPTDEFVESIPIRETRHYVKRVLGTYQLYNTLYGTGPLYPDWSSYNHVARPARK